MSQPAGMVCGAPSELGPYQRSSPIVCVFDTLFLFGRLIWHWYKTKHFRTAIKRLVKERFADRKEGQAGSMEDLRENVIFRWVLFALTISQIIKFYAMGGLVWTKVWASMYLFTFFATEALLLQTHHWVLSPSPDVAEQNTPPKNYGAASVTYISAGASVTWAGYFFIQGSREVAKSNGLDLSPGQMTGVLCFSIGFTIGIPSAIYSYKQVKDFKKVLPGCLLLLLSLVVPALYILVFSFKSVIAKFEEDWPEVLIAGLMVLYTLVYLQFISLTNVSMLETDEEGKDVGRPAEKASGFYFLCFNVVSAIMYYAYAYDSHGTYQPTWTQKLG